MYKILITYDTGDSFHTEELIEDYLEYEFKEYKFAQESLQRIKEHYEWYRSIHDSYRLTPKTVERPSWHKIQPVDSFWKDERDAPNYINLRLSEEKEVQFRPFWCGYFETLRSAEIKTKFDRVEF